MQDRGFVSRMDINFERSVRIELTPKAWQTLILPLNHDRLWSERLGSNQRQVVWKTTTLPLSYVRIYYLYPLMP